jgi:hypothetical protein
MSRAATEASRAEHNPLVVGLGRVGMTCYGIVYTLVAYLAIHIATGGGDQQADQKGALREVARPPVGGVLIWVLAIGLLALGPWEFLQAAVGFRAVTGTARRAAKRFGAVVRGTVGLALGIAAIGTATGSGSGGGDQSERSFTGKLLAMPGGRLLAVLVALVVVGAGVTAVVSGVLATFMTDLNTTELSDGSRRAIRTTGRIGHVAKGVAIGIVGVLLGVAAIQRDPGRAGGLDAALHTLAGQPFGTVLLLLTALGFAAFGAYCFAAARAAPHLTAVSPSAPGPPIFGEGGCRTMTRAGRGTSPCPQASLNDHQSKMTTHTGPQPPGHGDPRPSPKASGGPARAKNTARAPRT